MSSEAMRETAEKLVKYCREDETGKALYELYHPDAVSVESVPMPGSDNPKSEGLEAIKAKHDWWYSVYEVNSSDADGPYYHGDDHFSIIFEIDTTNKETGERSTMQDIGVYTVADGKIIREEFYY